MVKEGGPLTEGDLRQSPEGRQGSLSWGFCKELPQAEGAAGERLQTRAWWWVDMQRGRGRTRGGQDVTVLKGNQMDHGGCCVESRPAGGAEDAQVEAGRLGERRWPQPPR